MAILSTYGLKEDDEFNEITTYRLMYPECCQLAAPRVAGDLLSSAEQVDCLHEFTIEMWGILTDVVLQEWFGIRLPPSKLPWDGDIYLPDHLRLIYCLDRTHARQARYRIQSRYLSINHDPDRMSIFAGYGLSIPDEFQREREGLVYLARQAEHFRSLNDYLFITQNLYSKEDM